MLALGLRGSNAPPDVARFMLVIGALFVLQIWTWRRSRAVGVSVGWILLFAALFRLVALGVGLPRDAPLRALHDDLAGVETGYQPFLLYDNDVWRYLWEGHLTATGLGPYEKTPYEHLAEAEARAADAPPLESDLWWDVLDNTSFRTYTSVYPPVAQALFYLAHLLAPGSVLVLKLLLALIDLGACLGVAALLRALGRPDRDLLLYAWNPLVIKEFAGSGHVDTLMIALITWAAVAVLHRRDALGQVLLGVAIAAKLGALALVPLVWHRTRPATWPLAPLAAAVVSLPFLGGIGGLLGGLGTYAREWVFNSGPWVAIRHVAAAIGSSSPEAWANLLTKGAVVAVVFWSLRRRDLGAREWTRACFLTLAVLVVLNPAVMPWYLPWALPFAIAIGNRTWLAFSGLAFLSYWFYVDQGESTWWLWTEYLLLIGVATWEALRRRRHPRAWENRGS